mmetsp:Transcript_13461/g.32643  ORF Transcript_13461/g.32643 Transcript_13461/m.32643 type:complete len:342 (-) Transcript_13461:380-1405(-)
MAASSSFISPLSEMYLSRTPSSITISGVSSAESNVGALCTDSSSSTASLEVVSSQPPYFSPRALPSDSRTEIWVSITKAPTIDTFIASSSSEVVSVALANFFNTDFNSNIFSLNLSICFNPASLPRSVATFFFSSSSAITFSSSSLANCLRSIASPPNSSLHFSLRANESLISFEAFPAALKSRLDAAVFFSSSRMGSWTSMDDSSSFRFWMLVSAATTFWLASLTTASYFSTSPSSALMSSSPSSLEGPSALDRLNALLTISSKSLAILISPLISSINVSLVTISSEWAATTSSWAFLAFSIDSFSDVQSARLSSTDLDFFSRRPSCREYLDLTPCIELM